jgi:putative DNA methylase
VAGSRSTVVTDHKKKLIEVALPLEAINRESAREKSIRHGHPSTLHLWWARRPLAACRAVLFAQLVDDPSAHPDVWPTQEAQDAERQRLFGIIERLVKWENINNEGVLAEARGRSAAPAATPLQLFSIRSAAAAPSRSRPSASASKPMPAT